MKLGYLHSGTFRYLNSFGTRKSSSNVHLYSLTSSELGSNEFTLFFMQGKLETPRGC